MEKKLNKSPRKQLIFHAYTKYDEQTVESNMNLEKGEN